MSDSSTDSSVLDTSNLSGDISMNTGSANSNNNDTSNVSSAAQTAAIGDSNVNNRTDNDVDRDDDNTTPQLTPTPLEKLVASGWTASDHRALVVYIFTYMHNILPVKELIHLVVDPRCAHKHRPTVIDLNGTYKERQCQLFNQTIRVLIEVINCETNWAINFRYVELIAQWDKDTLRMFCILCIMIQYFGSQDAKLICADSELITLAASYVQKTEYYGFIGTEKLIRYIYTNQMRKINTNGINFNSELYVLACSNANNGLHSMDQQLIRDNATKEVDAMSDNHKLALIMTVFSTMFDNSKLNNESFHKFKGLDRRIWIIYPSDSTNNNQSEPSSSPFPKESIYNTPNSQENVSTLFNDSVIEQIENKVENENAPFELKPNIAKLTRQLQLPKLNLVYKLTQKQITDIFDQNLNGQKHIQKVLSSNNTAEVSKSTVVAYEAMQRQLMLHMTLFLYELYLAQPHNIQPRHIKQWLLRFNIDLESVNITIKLMYGPNAAAFTFAPIIDDSDDSGNANNAHVQDQARRSTEISDNTSNIDDIDTHVNSNENASVHAIPIVVNTNAGHAITAKDPTYLEYIKYKDDVRFGKTLNIMKNGQFGDLYGQFVGVKTTTESQYFDTTKKRSVMEGKIALERKKELEKIVSSNFTTTFSGDLTSNTRTCKNAMHKSWLLFAFAIITWLNAYCSDKPIEEAVLLRNIIKQLRGNAKKWYQIQSANGETETTISGFLNSLKLKFLKEVKLRSLKQLILARVPLESDVRFQKSEAFISFEYDCEHYNALVLCIKTSYNDYDSYISYKNMHDTAQKVLRSYKLLRTIQNVKGLNANPRTYKQLLNALNEGLQSENWFDDAKNETSDTKINTETSNITTNAGKNVNAFNQRKQGKYKKKMYDLNKYCKIHQSHKHSYYECNMYDPSKDPDKRNNDGNRDNGRKNHKKPYNNWKDKGKNGKNDPKFKKKKKFWDKKKNRKKQYAANKQSENQKNDKSDKKQISSMSINTMKIVQSSQSPGLQPIAQQDEPVIDDYDNWDKHLHASS